MRSRKILPVALVLVALAIPLAAVAQVVLRANTYSNRLIPAGPALLPAAGIGIPKRSQTARVMFTRDNWPAEGVDVTIEYTRDFREWTTCIGPTHIDAAVLDPKLGSIPKAGIACGWNPDIGIQPVRGRLRLDNFGPQFRSDINVEFTD